MILAGVSATHRLDLTNGEARRAQIRDLVHAGAGTYQEVADQLGLRQQTIAQHIRNMPDADLVRGQLAANKTGRRVAAFGETKTVFAWSKDGRCAVSLNTLNGRLATGAWAIEAAIATPAQTGRARLTDAQSARLAELAHAASQAHWRESGHVRRRDALKARDEYIRGLLRAGVPAVEVARAAGLAESRVGQIRDGRR
jgi:predicted ArsR family transcriptional regulator